MNVLDPGHSFVLEGVGGGDQIVSFLKKNSGVVQYPDQHPGPLTQEAMRAIISRLLFHQSQIPCAETEKAVEHVRHALWLVEARAWRRRQQRVNGTGRCHIYAIVPFDLDGIELLPTGPNGHITPPGDET